MAAWLISLAAQAQDAAAWSLERCVRHAQEVSLAIQQANQTVKGALLTEKQARANRLPNLSAGTDIGEQFGRTIDPTSNSFITTGIGYNQWRVSAGVTLFNGGQLHHSVKQAQWDALAARADAEQMANNLALQVASAYLNILLSEEQLAIARRRVEQSQQQLSNTDKLISAGTLPAADRLSLVAQIARDEQQVVVAQNTVDLAYLNLKQLLQFEPDYNLVIAKPENLVVPTDANPEGFSLKNIYNTALTTQATIRAGDFRLKSAETGVKIAAGGAYPRLSLFASLTSQFSTQARDYEGTPTVIDNGYGPASEILVNGTVVSVRFPDIEYDFPKQKYLDQINQNFGQGVGFSLDIPIYQNSRTTIGVQRAKLGITTAQIQNTQARQQLKTDIQTSIANARAAKQQLEAAQKTYDAMRLAYENTQKRHGLGAANGLELTTAKNNLDSAENDLVLSRYDYVFKLKIIDFYNGKRMSLDK